MFSYDNFGAYPPEQLAYAKAVSERLFDIYKHKPIAYIVTYGCQQNVSDSERIKGILEFLGYGFTDRPDNADFVLFNTCAVREHAEDRVYGNVGAIKKFKKSNPDMLLCVCGCMAQQEKNAQRFKNSFPYVDIVFGTQVSYRLPEFIYRRLTTGKRVFELSLDNGDIVEDIPVRRDGKIRGWLPIMYGCNNFCTYCIVPYVRGRERSRSPESILREAKEMVNAGFKEITLLGQNVNSYGKGSPYGVNFAQLLKMINGIDGDFRIRFMTSHPKDCTSQLLDAMAECEKVERHLHLPFQSGSDRILKLMNRHYDRETYLKLIDYARNRMPDIAFTSDIIVGFPGETYEDFKQTVSLVERVKFASLFTFIFSPRNGTPASNMEDSVSREEKGKWFSQLLEVQDRISKEYSISLVGKTVRVLCEEKSTKEGFLIGKSSGTASVEFEADDTYIGKFADVHIDEYTNVLKGTLIK